MSQTKSFHDSMQNWGPPPPKKLPRYPRKPRVNEIEKNGKQETDGDPSSDEREFSIDSTDTTADKSDPWIVPLEVNNNVVVFN